jgi:4'-phosphopantetheinyl transferase
LETVNVWSQGSTSVYRFDFSWKFGGLPHDRFYSPLLSESEKVFSASISNEVQRWRFVARRSMARLLLSRYISCEPESVDVRLTEFGKPYVFEYPIHFSTSSSGEFGFIGISTTAEIGVDIQMHVESMVDPEFELCTDAEKDAIRADPNSSDQFYRIWARKEACIKAIGYGLRYDLGSLDVLSDFAEMPERVQIWDLPAPDGYSASLAMVLK